MRKELYLKYREIFEKSYSEQIRDGKDFQGYVNLNDLKSKIRNFGLFIFIYSGDRTDITFSNVVYLVDKRPRYLVKNDYMALKIKIDMKSNSMIDKFPNQFNNIISSWIIQMGH